MISNKSNDTVNPLSVDNFAQPSKMCITHAWYATSSLISLPRTDVFRQYKCGCLAPKPIPTPIDRCTTWYRRKGCDQNQAISYLDFDCSEQCAWGLPEDQPYQNDNYIYYGRFDGQTSAEDRFFGRSRSPEGCRSERLLLNRPPPQMIKRIFVSTETEVDEHVDMKEGARDEAEHVDSDSDPYFSTISGRFTRRKK